MARKLDHRLGCVGIPVEIFEDRELLLRVNLIHERTDLHLPAAKVAAREKGAPSNLW